MDRGAWGATVCGVAELDTTEQLTLSHVRFTILTILKCPVARCVCVRLFVTPWTVACQVPLFMEFFSGRNTGVSSHFLLQGIFPTQELNLGLLHGRQILHHLSYQGSSWLLLN